MPQAWKQEVEGSEVSLLCKAPLSSHLGSPEALECLTSGRCNLHFCRYESGELREEKEEDEEAAADRDWKKQHRHPVKGGGH